MSQTLDFHLKNRDNKELSVDLSWFSTTPARSISGLGIFPYTPESKKLSKEDLDEAIEVISLEIKDCKRYRNRREADAEKYGALIGNSTTKEAVDALLEAIDECTNAISGWNSDIKDWEHVISTLEFIKSVAEENKETWDLYYYNC